MMPVDSPLISDFNAMRCGYILTKATSREQFGPPRLCEAMRDGSSEDDCQCEIRGCYWRYAAADGHSCTARLTSRRAKLVLRKQLTIRMVYVQTLNCTLEAKFQ